MSELKAMCEAAGFARVRTYIASGNVIFESNKSEAQVQAKFQRSLAAYAGKAVDVFVRTLAEMEAVLRQNPFPRAAPNRTVAVFLNGPPPKNTLETISGQDGEEVRLGVREIYIHYGAGMAHSKLKVPAASVGSARNMNTVAKLVAMAKAPST
jgi:uncharacterized protein (DUF1697 family)